MEAENPTCKYCYQAKIWKRNWQNFDLSREGKYRFANQIALQMIPNKFRIISFYSYNNIAIMGPSNLFISQKVSQPNSVTRMSWNCGKRIHMFNLGQHPINKIPILSMLTFKQYLAANLVLKPAHTHYTLHIQPKDLISSEKSQRNLEREETGS